MAKHSDDVNRQTAHGRRPRFVAYPQLSISTQRLLRRIDLYYVEFWNLATVDGLKQDRQARPRFTPTGLPLTGLYGRVQRSTAVRKCPTTWALGPVY